MNEIKVIAIDVDGTLLNSQKQLTRGVKNAILMARKAGIILIICHTYETNYAAYLKVREKVNLLVLDVLAKDGVSCAFPSRSIYVETLPREKK